jgi:hypothetical protein
MDKRTSGTVLDPNFPKDERNKVLAFRCRSVGAFDTEWNRSKRLAKAAAKMAEACGKDSMVLHGYFES